MVVRKIDCAHVTFTKSILGTGETTTLEITKEGGSPIDPTDALDVSIVAGAGTLQASGLSGSSLTNVHPPVTYTAPESIEGDSLVVKVATYSYHAGEAETTASSALPAMTPALKKGTEGVSSQAVSPQSNRAALERTGKLLASNSCTVGEGVVKKKARVPTEMTLSVSEPKVAAGATSGVIAALRGS